MQKNIDQLKQELVQEIKVLSAEIAKSNTYVGVLSNEMKFRALQEKFINLKFLEHKHIGLEIFDQPIPQVCDDKDNETWEVEEIAEIDLKEKAEEEIEVTKDDIHSDENPQTAEHEVEKMTENQTINHDFSDSDYAFDELISPKQFPRIKIDFNDKMAFLNQLFNGENAQMDFVIDTFNQMNSLHDSKLYLSNLKKEMNWNNKEEYVERLEALIVKRFE